MGAATGRRLGFEESQGFLRRPWRQWPGDLERDENGLWVVRRDIILRGGVPDYPWPPSLAETDRRPVEFWIRSTSSLAFNTTSSCRSNLATRSCYPIVYGPYRGFIGWS